MNRSMTHHRVAIARAALLAITLFASASALASGSGTITMMGKTAQIKDAYAYHHPASYDPAETMTTIVLCDRAIDTKKVSAGPDRDKAMHDWLAETKAVYWEVVLYQDGTLWMTNVAMPGVYSILGSSSRHNFSTTQNDAKRVEGSYVDPDDKDKENMEDAAFANAGSATSDIAKIDLKFAVDVN